MTTSPEPGLAVASSAAPARLAWAAGAWQEGRAFAARPEAVVTLFTALHLGMSFLNQVVLAYLFGVSGQMDAFLAASALPVTLTALLIGELGFALVPLLAHHPRQSGEEAELAGQLFWLVALGAFVVGGLGLATSSWLLRFTTSPATPPATLGLAGELAPWLWLIVGVHFVGSFLVGLSHYHRRFALPALTLSFPYAGMIVGGLGGAATLGIRAVVFGWLGGAVLKAAVLGAVIGRGGRLRLTGWGWHRAHRELVISLAALGLGLAPFTCFPVLDAYWASGLPAGSLASLGYANRLVIALTAVLVQGIAVVLFPAMAEDGAAGRREECRRRLAEALQRALLLLLPAAALTAALGEPLIALLFERGQFERADTLAVARILPFYLFGMIGMAAMNLISRGFFALRDYRTPAVLGVVALGVYAALCGGLTPGLSYVGIALAYAIVWPLLFLVQAYVLGRAMGPLLDRALGRLFLQAGASALLAALVARQLAGGLGALFGLWAGLLLGGLAGLLLFAALSCYLFRLPQWRLPWVSSRGGPKQ